MNNKIAMFGMQGFFVLIVFRGKGITSEAGVFSSCCYSSGCCPQIQVFKVWLSCGCPNRFFGFSIKSKINFFINIRSDSTVIFDV